MGADRGGKRDRKSKWRQKGEEEDGREEGKEREKDNRTKNVHREDRHTLATAQQKQEKGRGAGRKGEEVMILTQLFALEVMGGRSREEKGERRG